MSRNVTMALAALALGGFVLVGAVAAQESQPPQPPKPGPQHEILKQDEGVWDATVEMWMAPEAPPEVSKGVETNTMTGGGLWLVTDFKSQMMERPFEGHGIAGYDALKQKYVNTWVDSWSLAPSVGEASYDPATKTMTGVMEGPDMEGKISKTKTVTKWTDENTRVLTFYDEGKDKPSMRITYKRRQ